MRPFANDLGFDGPPFSWNPERRAFLRAELDACFVHLYGLYREEPATSWTRSRLLSVKMNPNSANTVRSYSSLKLGCQVEGERTMTESALCPLCLTRPVVGQGEHVIPKWFRSKFYPNSEGPFSHHRGGIAKLNNKGQLWEQDNLPVFLLPMCAGCNNIMSLRFESRVSRSAIRNFFDGLTVIGSERQLVSEWLLKTVILMAHPWTQVSIAGEQPIERREIGPDLLSWLIDGSPPPAWLSCWVARTGRRDGSDMREVSIERFNLPAFAINSVEYASRLFALGLGAGGSMVKIQVVYHPGSKLDHPLSDSSALDDSQTVLKVWPVTSDLCLEAITPLIGERIHQFDKAWGSPVWINFLASTNPLLVPWEIRIGWNWTDLQGAIGSGTIPGSL